MAKISKFKHIYKDHILPLNFCHRLAEPCKFNAKLQKRNRGLFPETYLSDEINQMILGHSVRMSLGFLPAEPRN